MFSHITISVLEFVWSTDGEYAFIESTFKVKIFNKSFQVGALPIPNDFNQWRNCPSSFISIHLKKNLFYGLINQEKKSIMPTFSAERI